MEIQLMFSSVIILQQTQIIDNIQVLTNSLQLSNIKYYKNSNGTIVITKKRNRTSIEANFAERIL